jgi:hypothetical protein
MIYGYLFLLNPTTRSTRPPPRLSPPSGPARCPADDVLAALAVTSGRSEDPDAAFLDGLERSKGHP